MAWKRCDDFDGTTDDVQAVPLGYGGDIYILHLGPASREQLDKDMAPWLAGVAPQMSMPKLNDGPPETTPHPAKKIRTVSKSAARTDSHKIREWAASQGIELAQLGRVPKHVIAAYDEAHKS